MTPDNDLENLFRAARENPPEAGTAFMARALAEAQAAQPLPRAVAVAPRRNLWARMAAAVGGAVAVAGIGTAAMAGLVIGYVQPEPMLTLAGTIGLGSAETLDLMTGYDALLTEDLSQ
jgi:hypothetical protein